MAKNIPSMKEIAERSKKPQQRDHVVTDQVSHDQAATDQIPRDDPQPQSATMPAQEVSKSANSVVTGNVVTDQIPVVAPPGFRVRTRIEKPHVSIYAHPKVLETVREIARAEGCKAHEIYIEGLRMALEKRGYDFDKLEKGG